MKKFIRFIMTICEFAIPVLLTAKYGVGAGVTAIFLMLCCALDFAMTDLIDAEKEENQDEV